MVHANSQWRNYTAATVSSKHTATQRQSKRTIRSKAEQEFMEVWRHFRAWHTLLPDIFTSVYVNVGRHTTIGRREKSQETRSEAASAAIKKHTSYYGPRVERRYRPVLLLRSAHQPPLASAMKPGSTHLDVLPSTSPSTNGCPYCC